MPFTAVDLLRAAALAGLWPATLSDGFVGFAVMFLVLGGCMVPRALRCGPRLDGIFCATVLVAGWAALADWYALVPGLDLLVHAASIGLIGTLAARLGDSWELFSADPARAAVARAILAVTVATTLATLWEFGEWLGHTHLDPRIQVGYTDTITDLVAGFIGAVVAGACVWGDRSRGADLDVPVQGRRATVPQ